MSDTYCPLPFVHFALVPSSRAKPCCRFSVQNESEIRDWKSVNHNNLGTEGTLNSEAFESVRKDMLAGKEIPGCWKCHKEEKSAGYSMRTLYNMRYPDYNNEIKLRYLEVSFGNYCNLSCRTCNSGLSTTWYEDDKKLSEKYDRKAYDKIIDIPFNWKPSDFEHVEEIKFVGGEPMLNPNFGKFLETVLATGRGKSIKLTIFTNSSWFPKPKIIELLHKFENVFIWLSIDSVGEKNNYIRNESEWDILSENAKKYLELETQTDIFSVTLTPTLNFLNIQDINILIDWWLDQRTQRNLPFIDRTDETDGFFSTGDIVFSSVYYPEEYSMRHIPNKRELIEKYTKILEGHKGKENYIFIKRIYHKIISMLKKDIDQEIDLMPFVQFTKDLDILRNQSFKDTFPELYEIVDNELQKDGKSYETLKGRF